MSDEEVLREGNVVIERARPEDIEQLVSLYTTAFIDMNLDSTPGVTEDDLRAHAQSGAYQARIRERLIEEIRDADRKAIFVARLGKQIVGFRSTNIDENGAHWNSGLFVSPFYRGRGIGANLTIESFNWHGDVDIYLDVAPNTPAVDFHRRFGFVPTGYSWEYPLVGGKHLRQEEMRSTPKSRADALRVERPHSA